MTTTTDHQTCPNWCEHRANPAKHDIEEYLDGASRISHVITFGPNVYGVEEVDVTTGERLPLSVQLIDVEWGSPGVAEQTPASLRDLMAQLAKAAEWLEANR